MALQRTQACASCLPAAGARLQRALPDISPFARPLRHRAHPPLPFRSRRRHTIWPPHASRRRPHHNPRRHVAGADGGAFRRFKGLQGQRSEANPRRVWRAGSRERGGARGLFAGFGNREKDALAYLSAGVPPERIFLVEPSSKIVGRAAVIALPTQMGDSVPTPQRRTWESYATMLASLDELFPSRRARAGDQEATIPLPAAPAAIDRDGRVPTDAVPFLM